jgi:phosphoserine phosphatase RsbU/P
MDSNSKILIADDSESYLKIIQQIFEIVGYKYNLIFARNGKEACELALMHQPDLIILDVIMPEMNGIDAAKFLRKNEETKNVPIIVLSSTESLKSAYEVGANDFISKPFNQYELLIKVRSALNLVDKIKLINEKNRILEEKHAKVIEQHSLIREQQKEVLGDLRYAKRIQNSILPPEKDINKILSEYFIVNLPRSHVSGDFYWIGNSGDRTAIAVADCTGHGLSGALLTMAGMAFLNDIMARGENLSPSDILFQLRNVVMHLLKQTGEEGEANDGMDISLTILSKDKTKLWFAGANNPLYLIQQEELFIYKGDRMPIGIHLNFDRPFTTHEIDIAKGDMVYLFSDGYADQFGGPKNKKFRYRQFQELLLANHLEPLSRQREILEKTFIDWKGDTFQIDDVLVMGYKI